MESQFLAQDLRHAMVKPQHVHSLVGKWLLLPLKIDWLFTWSWEF